MLAATRASRTAAARSLAMALPLAARTAASRSCRMRCANLEGAAWRPRVPASPPLPAIVPEAPAPTALGLRLPVAPSPSNCSSCCTCRPPSPPSGSAETTCSPSSPSCNDPAYSIVHFRCCEHIEQGRHGPAVGTRRGTQAPATARLCIRDSVVKQKTGACDDQQQQHRLQGAGEKKSSEFAARRGRVDRAPLIWRAVASRSPCRSRWLPAVQLAEPAVSSWFRSCCVCRQSLLAAWLESNGDQALSHTIAAERACSSRCQLGAACSCCGALHVL